MNKRRLTEKLTVRARERARAWASDQSFGDYLNELRAARRHGIEGGGGAPPGCVNEDDEGRPEK